MNISFSALAAYKILVYFFPSSCMPGKIARCLRLISLCNIWYSMYSIKYLILLLVFAGPLLLHLMKEAHQLLLTRSASPHADGQGMGLWKRLSFASFNCSPMTEWMQLGGRRCGTTCANHERRQRLWRVCFGGAQKEHQLIDFWVIWSRLESISGSHCNNQNDTTQLYKQHSGGFVNWRWTEIRPTEIFEADLLPWEEGLVVKPMWKW